MSKNTTLAKNIHGKEIVIHVELSWLIEDKFIVAKDMGLVNLELPEDLYELNCVGNNLTSLELPKTLRYLFCDKELFDYEKIDKSAILETHIHYGWK